MCLPVPTFHDFEEEIIFSSDSNGFGSDGDSDTEDVLLMDFELCIPFGSELFPHHGESISHVLSTVSSASKKKYQIQVPCDEIKSMKFPDQVSHLYNTSTTQFPDFQFQMLNQFLSSLIAPSLPARGERHGLQ